MFNHDIEVNFNLNRMGVAWFQQHSPKAVAHHNHKHCQGKAGKLGIPHGSLLSGNMNWSVTNVIVGVIMISTRVYIDM